MVSTPVSAPRRSAVPTLRLLDEAYHLLRRHPDALCIYLVGVIPFSLAFLYYWTDMSRSAFAHSRCVLGALLVALAFVWMKACQSRFVTLLQDRLSRVDPRPWSWRRWLRVAAIQTLLQSTAPLVLPPAAIVLFPYAWCIAFYQNLLVFGNGDGTPLRHIVAASWRQAFVWPRQNHEALSVLALFSAFVFFELLIGLFALPHLLRVLGGVETAFSQSGLHLLNSSLLATAAVLAYVIVDPLLKSAYALRCFYGESLQTGADLRAALHSISTPAPEARGKSRRSGAIIPAIFLALALGLAPNATAAPQPTTTPVDPRELRDAVEKTMARPQYAWRMPRENSTPRDADQGAIARFIQAMRDVGGWCWEKLVGIVKWLLRVLLRDASNPVRPATPTSAWDILVRALIMVLTIALTAVIILALWTWWRRGKGAGETVTDAVPLPEPNIEDEAVTADQLPVDGWLDLARDLLQQGQTRLSLRAAYLACLALLADHQMLTIARYKSNLDYHRELTRRGHRYPPVITSFGASVIVFERVWYGTHEATPETVESFLSALQMIRGTVEATTP